MLMSDLYDTGSISKLTADTGSAIAELTKALKQASDDSERMTTKIVWLTWALVGVGILQATATGWPYLAWWWAHR